MFVQSQQALPVLQVQEWVLLWTPGSQLILPGCAEGALSCSQGQLLLSVILRLCHLQHP